MVRIWLPGKVEIDEKTGKVKEGFDIITKNEIVITDLDKYNLLMSKLKDYKNYILHKDNNLSYEYSAANIPGIGCYGNYEYYRTIDGIEILYTDENSKYWGDPPDLVATFVNPKAFLTRILNLDTVDHSYGYRKDLLVKEDLEVDLSRLIRGSVEEMGHITKILESTKMSSEEMKNMLNRMFPEFGCFVTEALNCIDFAKVDEFSKKEIAVRKPFIEKEIYELNRMKIANYDKHIDLYASEAKAMKEALRNYDVAEENYKVLSLAKRLNKISK